MYALYSESLFSQKVTFEAKYDGGGNAEKELVLPMMAIHPSILTNIFNIMNCKKEQIQDVEYAIKRIAFLRDLK